MTRIRRPMTAAALALLIAPLAGYATAAGAADVKVEQAEITLPPRGAPSMAGYLIIKNGSEQSVGIEAVESQAFGSISIHVTTIENGVASMRPAPVPFQIPGHSELQMKPGGVHLMIADARTELEPGDTVSLSVRLKDGRVLETEAELIPFGRRPADHHHGAAHE